MDHFPAPIVVKDVVLGPLLRNSNKHRIVFAVSKNAESFPYIRVNKEKKFSSIADISIIDSADYSRRIDQICIYAGPVFLHFGHMAAEGIHRVWAAHLDTYKDCKLVFQASVRTGELPAWFYDLLAAYSIDRDRVIVVNENTYFSTLVVPEQGRILTGTNMIEGYSNIFPLSDFSDSSGFEAYAGKSKFYFSRSRHMHSGSYIGETCVENLLRKNGFEILYPENLGVALVSYIITTASTLIFCEGSAIHNMEHCGKIPAKVLVIGRRQGTKIRFGKVLDECCEDYAIFDNSSEIGSLNGDRDKINYVRSKSLSYIDAHEVIEFINDNIGSNMPLPNDEEIYGAMAMDIMKHVLNEKTYGSHTSNEQLGGLLRMMADNIHIRGFVDMLNQL